MYNLDLDTEKVYKPFFLFFDTQKLQDLLVSESLTSTKFSAHAICHFRDDILFPSSVGLYASSNTELCQSSIRQLSDTLSKKLLENPPHKLFNSDGKEIPLFDSAVYSKNRNFRMFLSSKLGKSTNLEIAEYCRFYGNGYKL